MVFGDVMTSSVSVFVAINHLVQLIQPLATFTLTVMGITWWVIRLKRYLSLGSVEDEGGAAWMAEDVGGETEEKQ